jgi:hypothetical protein
LFALPVSFLGLQTLLRSHWKNKIWCSKLSEISWKFQMLKKLSNFFRILVKKTPWTLPTFVINFHFFSHAILFSSGNGNVRKLRNALRGGGSSEICYRTVHCTGHL